MTTLRDQEKPQGSYVALMTEEISKRGGFRCFQCAEQIREVGAAFIVDPVSVYFVRIACATCAFLAGAA